MKHFRTLTAIALTGALAMSLTACGETEETVVESTPVETTIEETTETSIIEESIVDETTEETTIEETETVIEESPYYFSYYDVANNSSSEQNFISSVEVTNFNVRDLYLEDFDVTVQEYYCDASQDVVITLNSNKELTFRDLTEGIIWSSSNPTVDGATTEVNGDTYTVTIPADIMTSGTNYVITFDVNETGEHIVYICFVAE